MFRIINKTYWFTIYAALASVWGLSFLGVSLSLRDFTPIQVNFFRSLIGTITLCIVLGINKLNLRKSISYYVKLSIFALLSFVVPGILIAFAQLNLSSSLVSIFCASSPLLISMVAYFILRDEIFSKFALMGLIIGLAGVTLLILRNPSNLKVSIIPMLALVITVTCFGMNYYVLKKFIIPLGEDFATITFFQLFLSTLLQLPFINVITIVNMKVQLAPGLSLLFLGIFATGFAYIWNLRLMEYIGGVRTSTISYVVPFIASLAGVLILKDKLGFQEIVGGIFILVGILISNVQKNAYKA
jgi:drug/metabolite transporter (DMT)-like permease